MDWDEPLLQAIGTKPTSRATTTARKPTNLTPLPPHLGLGLGHLGQYASRYGLDVLSDERFSKKRVSLRKRFDDEFVRHKILDVIGDMALVGHPLIGHLVAHRGGHALHTEFAAMVLQETDAWTLVVSKEPSFSPQAVIDAPLASPF